MTSCAQSPFQAKLPHQRLSWPLSTKLIHGPQTFGSNAMPASYAKRRLGLRREVVATHDCVWDMGWGGAPLVSQALATSGPPVSIPTPTTVLLYLKAASSHGHALPFRGQAGELMLPGQLLVSD